MSTEGYVKHYAGDWAKAKVHDALGEMLDTTVLTYMKPRDVRVLHFPGIDMAETERVYLARGIPPQNIIGLEHKCEIADVIEKRGLGIQVPRNSKGKPLSLEEYVALHPSYNFDVISLDYVGPLEDTDLLLLTKFLQKQQRNSFILHHANLLRRENNNSHFIAGFVIQGYDNPHLKSIKEAEQASLEVGRKTTELMKKVGEGKSITEEKKESYTELIRTTFTGLGLDLRRKMLKYMTDNDFSLIAENLKKSIAVVDPEKVFDLNDPVGSVGCNPYALSYIDLNARRYFRHILEHEGVKEKDCQQVIEHAITSAADTEKRFCDQSCKKYTYISESGSPMIGDIHFLRYPYQIIQKAREVARLVGFPKEIRVKNFKSLKQALIEYCSVANHFKHFKSPEDTYKAERVFLGSSSKPVLTKKLFVVELERAECKEDVPKIVQKVKENYRCWEGKPLSQWQAHWRMNTYRSQDMVEESEDDSSLEKITEEQAREFLASNIPPQEIWEAYPTSFTLPQLRGFKAQLTKERKGGQAA